jgi:WD40 repeat protein
MSRNSDTGSQQLEEDNEAFLDLDDPENQILDDGENDVAVEDDDDDDDVPETAPEPEAETGPAPVDLNDVADIEPERDDAVASFQAPDKKPLHCVHINPANSSVIAVAGEGDEVFILTEQDSTLLLTATLRGHTDTITELAFSPNGELLASGGMDMTIRIWSCATWELLHVLSDLSGEIESILWHPSSLALVGSATDAQAALWNAKKGTLAMYFVGHRQSVTCTLWSADHKKLITGSTDGSIIVFNPKTGEQEVMVQKDLSPDTAGISSMRLFNEDIVIAGCDDGTIHLVSITKGKAVAHLQELHEQCIESISISGNGKLYATSSCDCKLVVWHSADHTKRAVFDVKEAVIPAVWVDNYLIAGFSDGCVRVWDGRSMAPEPVITWKGHRRMIVDLVVDPVKKRCFTACDDGSLRLFAIPEQ